MTTITLTLPDHAVEQARQFARERDISANAFLEAALLEVLEELEDLEEARASSVDLQSGAVSPVPWETVKARQRAKAGIADGPDLTGNPQERA